ncbi:molybdopterin-binding/glycosyltransferase family 2 protein [Breoghania sp. L-A4]|uniref:NTP transferase domain-containing protein n=1 Tax=Breoghania sp. L-A4 TaxID=2304600 RepID=UPI000E35EE18|nr:molybdopterin-binding/glycosyltransferase family 2 protein [Breoghania sp. L-A4]AXS39055.1 4-diphosphocytidyl-2C-methyl-D-erythritol kinase [Breoghania sp. L-A4]
MTFGERPLRDCLNGILAHSFKTDGLALRKGTRLTAEHIARLQAASVGSLTVAMLEASDVPEDEAARRIAAAIGGDTVEVERAFTGRANLFAAKAGVLCVDSAAIDALNRIDPAITFACLPQHAAVEAGRMVGTVKIIPYGVAGDLVERALETVGKQQDGLSLLRVAPYRPLKTAIISTTLPSLKPKTIDKTLSVTRDRLKPAGAEIVADLRVPHTAEATAAALREAKAGGAELLIVFGASANVDRGDVVPSAIEAAGGHVTHFGMPVDPGNLLVLGDLDGTPVIGAPGCARSPRENGFDWVLQRTLAGLEVSAADLTGMGVGGLLMEIVSRPQPREEAPRATAAPRPDVAAIVLAAGRSTRMGGPNKLLATIGGEPLVRIAARAALESRAGPVTVVTGHMRDQVEAALEDLDVRFVHNEDYREGLSTSLKTGIKALPASADAAIVLLADMPRITPQTIDRLVAAYDPAAGALIVVPTVKGKRGNPVLWSRRYFDALLAIKGDVGARHLIGDNPEAVVEIELDDTIRLDLDTPQALEAAGGVLPNA